MDIIALDVGGTKLSAAVFRDDVQIASKIKEIDKNGGDLAYSQLKEMLLDLLNDKSLGTDKISAIGICIPGIYYSESGNVWAPNIKGWDDFPLLQKLKEDLPKDLRIKIDSDRACYILGEQWKGKAKGYKDAIFLAVGTGIGAGILIDGKILRGANDIAGAIGWLALDKPFHDKYINYGCFEYHASGDGIARVARELLQKENNSSLNKIELKSLTSKDVFEAFEKEDSLAKEALKIAVEFWGMSAANLVSLFNPEVIIFGGGVFGPASRFIDDIYDEAKKWAQPISIRKVKFFASKIGSKAGLFGAAYLALNPTL